jgi:hypothetical protein
LSRRTWQYLGWPAVSLMLLYCIMNRVRMITRVGPCMQVSIHPDGPDQGDVHEYPLLSLPCYRRLCLAAVTAAALRLLLRLLLHDAACMARDGTGQAPLGKLLVDGHLDSVHGGVHGVQGRPHVQGKRLQVISKSRGQLTCVSFVVCRLTSQPGCHRHRSQDATDKGGDSARVQMCAAGVVHCVQLLWQSNRHRQSTCRC